MSPETKQQALIKLHGIRNKIGYPDKWRDYSSLTIVHGDFCGQHRSGPTNSSAIATSTKLASRSTGTNGTFRRLRLIAYYNPQMNDINFPAGVLQPPVYDAKMDDAPNYGDTGGTIGHELTHGFDDEGSQFDAKGNLRNWWTKEDREKFDARTKCVEDQYAQYVVVDDVHINSEAHAGRRCGRPGRRNPGFHGVERCDQRQEPSADRRAHSRAAFLRRLCAVGLRQCATGRSSAFGP